MTKAYNQTIDRNNKLTFNDFGFIANKNTGVRDNMYKYIMNTPTHEILTMFCKNRSFHNLCTVSHISPSTVRVLGLNLKTGLCLKKPPKDASDIDFDRFRTDTRWKFQFIDTEDEDEADRNFNPKLHIPSPNEPPHASNEIERAMSDFENDIKAKIAMNKIHFKTNLSKHEQGCLEKLKNNKDIIILQTDKNLGPAAMETEAYVEQVLTEHLFTSTYTIINQNDAMKIMEEAGLKMWDLLHEMVENNYFHGNEATFIKRSFMLKSKFRVAQFYGAPKVHKNPIKLRPVVSKCGTELEVLSKTLDSIFQRIISEAQKQQRNPSNDAEEFLLLPAYLKDSWDLIDALKKLPNLHPLDRLFTIDAISMYTNINTEFALETIEQWYNKHSVRFKKMGLPPTNIVIQGLKLVMENNVFQFDDIFCHQQNGTAMGTSVACTYATIFQGAYEETNIIPKMESFGTRFYRRLIDDGFGIIRDEGDNFKNIFKEFNQHGPPDKRLSWTSPGPTTTTNFLDLTISISNCKIVFKSYIKEAHLHLYLPAHSAHPESNLAGMIFGRLRSFWLQNSSVEDYVFFTKNFFEHLTRRGHAHATLDRLFTQAALKLQQVSCRTPSVIEKSAYFHVKYHPFQITRHDIHESYARHCAPVLGARPNINRPSLEIKRLVIAQSRAPNLKDKVCSSQLHLEPGYRASDLLNKLTNQPPP
jgi:hypothetical protein